MSLFLLQNLQVWHTWPLNFNLRAQLANWKLHIKACEFRLWGLTMHRVDTFLAQLPELMLLTFLFFILFTFPFAFSWQHFPSPQRYNRTFNGWIEKVTGAYIFRQSKKKTKKNQTRREKQSVQTASDPEKNGFRFAFLSPPPTLPSSSYTSSRSNLI